MYYRIRYRQATGKEFFRVVKTNHGFAGVVKLAEASFLIQEQDIISITREEA